MITCEYLMPILTLIAIIGGPIVGVRVARQMEDRKQHQQQRIGILASLLRTSQGTARLSAEHVGALNLIPLMFHGEKAVLDVYRRYIKYLNTYPLDPAKGQERFLDLLSALAATLGYSFDKTDLENFSYAPQGWANDIQAQYEIRNLLVGLLQGQESLRVSVVPPPPRTEESPPAPSA